MLAISLKIKLNTTKYRVNAISFNDNRHLLYYFQMIIINNREVMILIEIKSSSLDELGFNQSTILLFKILLESFD